MIRSSHLELKLQKFLSKTLYYYNKGTRKTKDFQKLSNKEIYFILQSNSTKYKKLSQFISQLNFLEGHHVLSPEIWNKIFTDWFKKCFDGYLFPNPTIHRMGNAPNIPCPRCKELFNFKWNLVSLLLLSLALKKPFRRPFKQ